MRIFKKLIYCFFACMVISSPLILASAISYEVRVDDWLNMRSSPEVSSNNIIAKLPNRAVVTVDEIRSDNFGRVTYQGKTGFICLNFAVMRDGQGRYKIKADGGLNLRSDMSCSSSVLLTISNGTEIDVKEVRGKWAKTSYEGRVGWVYKDYISKINPETVRMDPERYVVNSSDGINVRTGAGTQFGIISALSNGTCIDIIEIVDGWGKTRISGRDGFVCMQYVKKLSDRSHTRLCMPVGPGLSVITQMYRDGHRAVDIGSLGGKNINIMSIMDGEIIKTGSEDSAGNYIIISHDNGYLSKYMHLMSMNVQVGDRVSCGDVIGLMGTTGRSTGVHLHFVVQRCQEVLNPIEFFGDCWKL